MGMFPGLIKINAQALVLGGYGALQDSDPTKFDAALSLYHLSASDVAAINSSFKSGNAGTRCN